MREARPIAALLALVAMTVAGPVAGRAQTVEGETAGEPGVVARVNGEPILLEDLERQLGAIHSEAREGDRAAFDPERLLFRAVNDLLLGQEARALGMDEEAPVASKVEEQRQELAVRLLERQEISGRAEVADEEVRKAFEEQYREVAFRVLTLYERDEAERTLAELRAGADMETLARERSVDPYARRGGEVRSLPRIELQVEIADLLFSLEDGELGGPVRTDLGWSIVRPESFRGADPERFTAVERSLRELLRFRKASALRARLAAAAGERYPVRVDEEELAAIRPKRLPDARLIPEYGDPEKVLVRIGEDLTIGVGEYAKALVNRWSGVRNEEAARAAAPIVLERMIEERLLLAEALGRGYAERPEVERALRAFETRLLVPRFLEEVLAAEVKVEPAEIESYYDEHREEFRKPPRVRVGQITVASEEEAEELAALLRSGTDLAWLARRHSTDRFKEAGGDRGWISPAPGADSLSDRLLESEVGEVLGPFGAPGTYRVIVVTARQEQGVYPFQEVSGNVREKVFAQKFELLLESFMEKLRSRSEIEIDRQALAALRITGSREPGAGEGQDGNAE